jgi:hypothetical protein
MYGFNSQYSNRQEYGQANNLSKILEKTNYTLRNTVNFKKITLNFLKKPSVYEGEGGGEGKVKERKLTKTVCSQNINVGRAGPPEPSILFKINSLTQNQENI